MSWLTLKDNGLTEGRREEKWGEKDKVLTISSRFSKEKHRLFFSNLTWNTSNMSPIPTPDWVKALKPSSPQGTDLLKAERDKSNISVEKLSNFLFTKEVLERKLRILNILQAEKVFDKSQNYFDGRIERFQTALARAKKLRQLQVRHNWNRDEFMVANELISEPGPYGLHASMYLVILFCFLIRELTLNDYRRHSVIKEHPNNTNSF